ncbi:MAG: sugar ABC transporter permease [Clostridia bacterium]|nr:sugar ABC transporter permease [Clostridia bacterium]
MAKKAKEAKLANGTMTKRQWTWHLMKRYKVGYFMIIPFMLLFFVFTIIPVAASLLVGFTDYNMIEIPNWVGLDNYITLFLDDDLFITALKNTMIFAVLTGPTSFILSFIVAWFINELSPRTRSIVTLIFYAPSISGGAYTIFQYIFASDSYGLVNGWLLKFGFIDSPILFFTDVNYIVPLCVAISLWMSLGTSFLSFIAGLQGIDRAQFEAASVDGITNRWQELWYVTLPNMKPQLMFGSIMAITGSFGYGAMVSVLAGNPSTDYVAYTISHHIEEYGGARMEIGYSSAISFILFLIMIAANMFVQKLLSKVGE